MASLRGFCRTLVAALREILDESAYERFLALRSLSRSRASYAQFRREWLEKRTARRPPCC